MYIYTMEYYSALRKKEILPFIATWMNLEDTMLSEISQKQKYKYCMNSAMEGIQSGQAHGGGENGDCHGLEVGWDGEMFVMGYKFLVIQDKFMYNSVTITVLYCILKFAKRIDFVCS